MAGPGGRAAEGMMRYGDTVCLADTLNGGFVSNDGINASPFIEVRLCLCANFPLANLLLSASSDLSATRMILNLSPDFVSETVGASTAMSNPLQVFYHVAFAFVLLNSSRSFLPSQALFHLKHVRSKRYQQYQQRMVLCECCCLHGTSILLLVFMFWPHLCSYICTCAMCLVCVCLCV